MNEELQKALSDLINKAVSGTEAIVEFGKQEIPVVIEQLLMWHFVESLVWFIAGVIAIIGGAVFLKKVTYNTFIPSPKKIARAREAFENKEPWTRFHGDTDSDCTSLEYDAIVNNRVTEERIMVAIVGGAISFFITAFTSLGVIDNLTWLKIWLAPKLYLLEYGASLVK